MSEDARKVRPLSLEGQGRVGLRLRTSSGGDDPPSPSTPSLLDTSLLDTSSQPRKRTSTGASRSKRIMWSTQNSIIQSFSTGSHGTMTVSWEACPRTVLIVKVSAGGRAHCAVPTQLLRRRQPGSEMFALSLLSLARSLSLSPAVSARLARALLPCHPRTRAIRTMHRYRVEVEVRGDRPGDG